MTRGDLSNRLIHLTSGDTIVEAFKRFLSVLNKKRLIANDGHIKGGHKCVCFSEAPIAILAQMLAYKDSRYQPFGVMVDKAWLFKLGGRPVIYQPDDEYETLPPDVRYRHVRYEPTESPEKPIDFTWEREWRIPKDVILSPAQVTLVVPNRAFVDFAKAENKSAAPDDDLETTGFRSLDWHYIALEDLGVTVDI
jgi:hypothetical protein